MNNIRWEFLSIDKKTKDIMIDRLLGINKGYGATDAELEEQRKRLSGFTDRGLYNAYNKSYAYAAPHWHFQNARVLMEYMNGEKEREREMEFKQMIRETMDAFNKIDYNVGADGKYNLLIYVQKSLEDTPQIEDIIKLLVSNNLVYNRKRPFNEKKGDRIQIVFVDYDG